jgi:hypothetical protein
MPRYVDPKTGAYTLIELLASSAIEVPDGSTIAVSGTAWPGDGGARTLVVKRYDSSPANGTTTFPLPGGGLLATQGALGSGGTLDARLAGVVADGVELADGVCVAGSTEITSASASFFTQAKAGMRILLKTPSMPLTGTVTVTAGEPFIAGVGTNFLADVRDLPYTGPGKGCSLRIGNEIYVVNNFISNTRVQITRTPTVAVAGATAYREQQLESTIISVNSPTSITIAHAPVVSGTGVELFFGTDNSAAILAGVARADIDEQSFLLPSGLIGVYSNMAWDGLSRLSIAGAGRGVTVVRDLRRASRELIWTDLDAALFTVRNSSFITLQDFSIHGSVPVLGFQHSDGGGVNANGGRIGCMLRDCANSGYLRMGSAGYASRDEYLTAQGDSPGFFCLDCDCPDTNNVSLNLNTSNTCERARIANNSFRSFYTPFLCGSGNAVVSGNIFDTYPDLDVGASMVVIDSAARMVFTGNTIRNARSIYSGVSALEVFGNNPAAGTIQISSNIFENCYGLYHDHGLISIKNLTGTLRIDNNQAFNCRGSDVGGKFVVVEAPSAKRVTVSNNTFYGDATSKMALGVVVDDVPDGVVIASNNDYGPGTLKSLNHIVSGYESAFLRLLHVGLELDQYEVDAVSGKVSRFYDRMDYSHYISQAASGAQVAVPTAEALVGGRSVGRFTGAQYYQSNRSASDWFWAHYLDYMSLAVLVPRAAAAATHYCVWDTNAFNPSGRGAALSYYGATQANYFVGNGAGGVSYVLQNSTNTIGAAKVLATHRTAGTTFIRNTKALTPEAAVADTGAADVGAAVSPLTVGATSTPLAFGNYDLAGLYFLRSASGAPEIAKISAYLGWRYGL